MTGSVVGAIDQGTTSTRFMVFDHRGAVVASAQREFEQIFPQPGWVEHDPIEIWQTVEVVVAEALAAASLAPSDLVAVGITNQRETTVAWDRRTGLPLANAIVWQDTRTADLCADLAGDEGLDRFRPITGLPLATYFSGPKASWLLRTVDANTLSLIAYVTPAVALFLGWWVRGETLRSTTIAGTGLILLGVVLVVRRRRTT